MKPQTCTEVYQVLVEECGANPDKLVYFTLNQGRQNVNRMPSEYRFMGALGTGGKFYRATGDTRWYVTCYHEDRTPERAAMIERANERLAKLHSQFS